MCIRDSIKTHHCPGADFGVVTHSNTAYQHRSGANQAMIPDLRRGAVHLPNGNVLIDAAIRTNTGIPGNINPVQAVRQHRPADVYKRQLIRRGCKVIRVPGSTTAEEVLAYNPDGIMLSNGPGDPSENTAIINELQKIADCGVPVFGICLGHQLMALAMGAKTEKLHYGHRGANQCV